VVSFQLLLSGISINTGTIKYDRTVDIITEYYCFMFSYYM